METSPFFITITATYIYSHVLTLFYNIDYISKRGRAWSRAVNGNLRQLHCHLM